MGVARLRHASGFRPIGTEQHAVNDGRLYSQLPEAAVKTHFSRVFSMACLAVPLVAISMPLLTPQAVAQPSTTPTIFPEIFVVAPREVERNVVSRPYNASTRIPVEEVTLTRVVFFDDLDLTKSADIDTLRTRVKDMATEACKELDQISPEGRGNPTVQMPKTCFQTAMDGAMPQVVAAIEASGAK
jgi:UrcA family protein